MFRAGRQKIFSFGIRIPRKGEDVKAEEGRKTKVLSIGTLFFCPFAARGPAEKPERSEGIATAEPGQRPPGRERPASGERRQGQRAGARPSGPRARGRRQAAASAPGAGERGAGNPGRKGRGPGRPGGPTPKGRKEAREQTDERQERSATTLRGATANGASERGPKAPRGNDATGPAGAVPLTFPFLLD